MPFLADREALSVDEGLAARRPGPVAALYIHVDRLKSINDYLGHSAGDWFIRVFPQRLRVKVGRLDVIARIGGDEFVFVPNQPMSADDAESFARQLQTMMQYGVLIGGELVSRTTSIGVAIGIPGHDTASDLLRQADQATLAAKRAGGNQVAVSTEDMSLKGAFQHFRQAPYPSGGRLAGVKMWPGRLSTSIVSWVCEPADKLGAGARPARVTHCRFEVRHRSHILSEFTRKEAAMAVVAPG